VARRFPPVPELQDPLDQPRGGSLWVRRSEPFPVARRRGLHAPTGRLPAQADEGLEVPLEPEVILDAAVVDPA
jgi:hypothetical protein